MARSRNEGPTLRTRRASRGKRPPDLPRDLNGKFISFGPADDPGTRTRFAQFKAEWESAGCGSAIEQRGHAATFTAVRRVA